MASSARSQLWVYEPGGGAMEANTARCRAAASAKTHTFAPRLQKDTYQKKTLRHIVDQLFEGTTSSLVKNLINDEEISEVEKQAIKKLIEEKL